MENARSLATFIEGAPTSYHAAANLARLADYAGFRRQEDVDAWDATPGNHYLVRDGAFLAWNVPEERPTHFRIVGSHTDSPSLKVKPNMTSHHGGFEQVDVEIYGGPLFNSWLNRDLGLAGRVVLRSGEVRLVSIPGCMVIPQLAPHLDRSVNSDLKLNPQAHLHPILTSHLVAGAPDLPADAPLLHMVAAAAGVEPSEIAWHDLLAFPSERPALTGDFLAAPRQDNLTSVHASFRAFIDAFGAREHTHEGDGVSAPAPQSSEPQHDDPALAPAAGTDSAAAHMRPAVSSFGSSALGEEPFIAVLAAFDHEEVGSRTPTGAAGPILESVLARTTRALGIEGDEYDRMLARSTVLSSDTGHSLNPNYAEFYDPDDAPVAGRGPLVKFNAQASYASDARSVAVVCAAFERAGAPLQDFVSNNAVPCGTTIGPITAARIGVSTVDVGVPLLSMHSTRELSHADDLLALRRGIAGFWGVAREAAKEAEEASTGREDAATEGKAQGA